MKKAILAAVAFSILAVPMAQAQTSSSRSAEKRIEQRFERPGASGHSYRRHEVRKPRYERGNRYTNWKRHHEMRDWKRHGLRKPGHGQRWIRVGNDYLLITIASGVIAGIIAGR